MLDLIEEALRGTSLAYAIAEPKAFPGNVPTLKSEDDEDRVFSILREYLETCHACLAACEMPITSAPEIARASGILDGFLYAHEQAKLSEDDWRCPSCGADAEGGAAE